MKINPNDEIKAKVSLLYIIRSIDFPITNEQLVNYCLEHELIDFYDLQEFLLSLVKNALLEHTPVKYESDDGVHSEEHYYLLTKTGSDTLQLFEENLSPYFKRKVDRTTAQLKKNLSTEYSFRQEFHQDRYGYFEVNLTAKNGALNLIDIRLSAENNKLARSITERWKKNPLEIYTKIMEVLTANSRESVENAEEE